MQVKTKKLGLVAITAIVGAGLFATTSLRAEQISDEEIEANRKNCVTNRNAAACFFYGNATYAKAVNGRKDATVSEDDVKVDINIALGWIVDSCSYGAAQACDTLGYIYTEGRDGAVVDKERGHAYFVKACKADLKFCSNLSSEEAAKPDVCPEIFVNAKTAMLTVSDFEKSLDIKEKDLVRRKNSGDMSVNKDIESYNRSRSAVNNGKCETAISYAKLARTNYCPSNITDRLLADAKDYSKGIIAGDANTSCFYSINNF